MWSCLPLVLEGTWLPGLIVFGPGLDSSCSDCHCAFVQGSSKPSSPALYLAQVIQIGQHPMTKVSNGSHNGSPGFKSPGCDLGHVI